MKVSRNFRRAVQNSKVEINRLTVQLCTGGQSSSIVYGRYVITYKQNNGGCTVSYVDNKVVGGNKKEVFVPEENYLELCNKDLKLMMENRKVEFYSFGVSISGIETELSKKFIDGIEETMKSAKSLTSRTVATYNTSLSGLAQLVGIFPAEKLEVIDFKGEGSVGFEQLINSDQWKKAKKFDGLWSLSIPIEHFLHFEFFKVDLAIFTEDDAVKICDVGYLMKMF